MLQGLKIGVVIPAYNEEERLANTLKGLPDYIDAVVVVDDASPDRTQAVAAASVDHRVRVLRHRENLGVGAAIRSGYRELFSEDIDVYVVMAGDNQMDPADLPRLLAPIAERRAAYVKGNRFAHPERRKMPFLRRLGSRFLARATNLASGLAIDDSQCGYTALAAEAARELPLDDLWPRYGYPNDLLLLLSAGGFQVAEVPVRPVYAGEASGLRPYHVLTILYVIVRRRILAARR